jgi:hypothetical protein
MAKRGDNFPVNPMSNIFRPKANRSTWTGSRKFIALLLAVIPSIPVAALAADFIPATRRVPWTPGVTVGVPGGIPTNRTNVINAADAPYHADYSGATDARAAIQAAIDAAASTPGTIVYLRAGTYRLNGSLSFPWGRNNITLRGAGMAQTTLAVHGAVQVGIYVGAMENYGPPFGGSYADVAISAGLAKGSTQVTIGTTNGFAVGQQMRIAAANDPALPHFSSGGDYLRAQNVRVTAKTATTLSFSPPLYEDYGGGAFPAGVSTGANGFYNRGIGLEGFTLDCSNSTAQNGGGVFAGIQVENTNSSWLKEVKVVQAGNYPLFFYFCSEIEVRRCHFGALKNPNGSNRAGILCNATSASLFEDNIIVHQQPNIEVNTGSSGNAFSRNYTQSNSFGIDSNHSAHNQFNLYEGNVAGLFIADGYFGSVSDDTVFRNKLGATVSLKRFTRRYNVACNYLFDGFQLGLPFIGNTNFSGEANHPSTTWRDFESATQPYLAATLTTRASATEGTLTFATKTGSITNGWQWIDIRWEGGQFIAMQVGTVSGLTATIRPYLHGGTLPPVGTAIKVWTGPAGYSEKDLGVEATLIAGGNRRTDNNTVSALTGDVPSSFLYGEIKPQWLIDAETELGRTFTLKGFSPETTATTSDQDIPAGYRHANPTAPLVFNNAPPTQVRIVRQ